MIALVSMTLTMEGSGLLLLLQMGRSGWKPILPLADATHYFLVVVVVTMLDCAAPTASLLLIVISSSAAGN